mmetsp:Transcript_4437/g.7931  ORF Transcript_4437/g.7931 Transcript_4437/m.7931 type:complete len:235 (+) Transcript_4437:300-1004(+)
MKGMKEETHGRIRHQLINRHHHHHHHHRRRRCRIHHQIRLFHLFLLLLFHFPFHFHLPPSPLLSDCYPLPLPPSSLPRALSNLLQFPYLPVHVLVPFSTEEQQWWALALYPWTSNSFRRCRREIGLEFRYRTREIPRKLAVWTLGIPGNSLQSLQEWFESLKRVVELLGVQEGMRRRTVVVVVVVIVVVAVVEKKRRRRWKWSEKREEGRERREEGGSGRRRRRRVWRGRRGGR